MLFCTVLNFVLFSQNFGVGLGFQAYNYKGETLESLVSLGDFSGPFMEEAKSVEGQVGGVGIYLYYHYPFYHISNSFAMGVSPTLTGYFYNEQDEGVEIINTGNTVQGGGSMFAAFHVPIYITVAYGSYTDKDYESEFGVVVGIGYAYQTFKSDEPIGDKVSQIIPSVFLEIGTSAFGIRGNVSLKSYKSKYEMTTGELPKVKYTNWGIALLAKF